MDSCYSFSIFVDWNVPSACTAMMYIPFERLDMFRSYRPLLSEEMVWLMISVPVMLISFKVLLVLV